MTAIAPVTFLDTFSRSTLNSFGTADSGQAWTGTNANYDTYSAGYGRIYVAAGQARNVAYVDVDNNSSQEVLMKVKWNVDSLTDHGPVIRREDSDSYYFVRIQDFYHEIAISASINGTIYELNRVTGVTLNKNTYYWVRFRSDTTLKFRIWAEGTLEPVSWTITSAFFDGSNPPGAGDFGYYTLGTSSTYSVYLDTAYWYSLEETTLGLPVTETFTRDVDKGWGRSDSSHTWEGFLADDPLYYVLPHEGDVFSGGYARLTTGNSTSRFGIIGPSVADSSVLTEFYIDVATNSPTVEIGIRGTIGDDGAGQYQFTGYFVRITWGSTGVTLRKVSTMGGTSSSIGSNTLGAAPLAGELWWARIECTGTTVRSRVWKNGTAEPGAFQISVTDASLASGRSFVRLVGAASTTHNFRIYDHSHAVITTGNELITGTLTTASVTDSSFAITAAYTGDANTNSTCVIQYKQTGTDTWTSPSVTTNRGPKTFTASATGLTANTSYDVQATYSDANGVTGTNPRTTTVSTIITGLDTGAISLVADATTIVVTATYTGDSDNDSTALCEYRIGVGGWTSAGAMTANRGPKTFTKTISGLANDTTYEVRATYTDADAVRGTNPVSASTTTLGQGVRFASTAITVSPTDTAAVVSVYYELDTNDNSEIAVQFKSIRDSIWTTINSTAITVVRGSKLWRITLTGLVPNLSYQVIVYLSDPNGVIAGTEMNATAVFTTTGNISDPDLRGKHYLYKVYSEDGDYLGTWHDAPEPKFAWHENGGVSDLSVDLPRRIASLNSDPTIDFGHRVDIWAIDGTSQGMGVNLILDSDIDLGSWTLATSWTVSATGGPDDSAALRFTSGATTQRTVYSEYITVDSIVPLVAKAICKARGGKLRMSILCYDDASVLLGTSDSSETVGNGWQGLTATYTPLEGTAKVRVSFTNIGSGTMYVDKISLRQKEVLVYRGRIESYTAKVNAEGEEVNVEILGLSSQLTDIYIRFLQYVTVQPVQDVHEHPNENRTATDPSNIMKALIDQAQHDNARCDLYYDATSIKLTGNTVQYTFRDKQLLGCFDSLRTLCPPGWHWFIDPDGRVNLRGPEHVYTHPLRLNVEIMDFENEKTIRNMKNYIIVKGRQDADLSETDGFGTIEHHASDPVSIARYGLRMLFIRDANIKDPDTAELVAEGRLEEYNVAEEAGKASVPDEKDILYAGGALRGYNIEAFRPGDFVTVKDPVAGGQRTYWDQFSWDNGAWDDTDSRVLPMAVPIKTIQYYGDKVELELSERQPSATGDFARLARWLRTQDKGDES